MEKESQAVVGRIGFFNPEGWPGFEIGWALLRRYWGRGFATEGARAALAYAFTKLGRDHVISVIHPDDERSIKVAERLGERLEWTVQLHQADALIYGISVEQWRRTVSVRTPSP